MTLGAAGAGGTPTLRSYGPFDVYFYNAGDVSGSGTFAYTGAKNWTEAEMTDVAESIRSWDANIINDPGRRIKMAVVWYNFSGSILGGSESPSNGDGSTSWKYGERVWRDQVNYNGPWTGWDTRIIYDTDAAGYSWNIGAGAPSGSQIDFRSVVTHEIGHSVGFAPSYYSSYDDWGNTWGSSTNPYSWQGYKGLTRWDSFLRDNSGNQPNNGGTGTPGNFNQTSNPAYFVGPYAVAYNGGNVPIYAPTTYSSGSSLSHLNQNTYPNALMKPFISLGQMTRKPTLLEWEMMRDMGWSLLNQWKGPGSGTYNSVDSWSWDQIPNAVGATANFLGNIESAATVSLTGSVTLGTINFNSAYSYSVSGSTITLDVSSGQSAVNVAAGAHTIASAVTLNDDVTITSAASMGLAMTGNLTAAGCTITKAGAGTVQFENLRAAGLNVSGGTARVRARSTANDPTGTSVVQSLSIAAGAQLDLTNNSAIWDYTGASPINAVWTMLWSGRLISSAADATRNLGYKESGAAGTFAGQPVDADAVLIKYTYLGDANLDGQVDITDLGNLATGWQSGGLWSSGDFDYSGFIDITDLGLLATNWQAGVGNPLGPDSLSEALAALGLPAVSVPEPVALAGAMLCLAGVTARRARR